jgi:hypothetical protein
MAGVHVTMRFNNLFQRIAVIDDGLELAGLNQLSEEDKVLDLLN